MNNKRKAFLAYGYSAKNAGDLAICVGAMDLLIEQNYQVVILSKYDKSDPEFLSSKIYYTQRYGENVQVLESPFTLNRKESIFKKLIHNFKGFLVFAGFSSKRDVIVRNEIKNCDLVIFNGGNLLRCSSIIDYVRLVALYYPIKLANHFQKDYIIFPHSSAEINDMGRGIIKKMLKGAKMVFAREDISYRKLKSEFQLTNIHSSIDLAFFISNNGISSDSEVINNQKKVGFTFRAHTVGDIHEFPLEEKEKIQNNILSVFKHLSSEVKYYFVIQTQKDREFTYDIKNKIEQSMELSIEVFENYDPVDLIEFYKRIDLLIGMRLHSIILATSIGTPAYGLFYKEWGLKNPGLMEKLELPYILLDGGREIDLEEVDLVLSEKQAFSHRVKRIILAEKNKLKEVL